ncbi:MAG: branched-chain amino acid aminotransferase [Candidatus Helarchaeota archaeon]
MTDVNIDWDNLGFDFMPTRAMFVSKWEESTGWDEGKLVPFGNIEISPAAGVLNYGQGLFEGLKALRTKENKIVLFRPIDNGIRLKNGCERLLIPPYKPEKFVEDVKKTVKANEDYVPPYGKGALYIRPILIGTGPVLGVAPAPSYHFIIFVVPVGPYYKEGFNPIKLAITEFHRAAPRGTGGIKTLCNYAGSMLPAKKVKEKGYNQELYLDAANNKYIEEVGTANFFCVIDNVLMTPKLTGSILPGNTRASIIEIARKKLNMKVEERYITVDEVLKASEVFCSGTAAVVTPIGSLFYKGKDYIFNDFKVGSITQKLYDLLTKIQLQEEEDIFGWVTEVESDLEIKIQT